jgi:hypothetical protein
MSLWRKRNVKHNEQKHDNLSNPLDRLHEENVRLGLYEDAYDLSIKSEDLSIKSEEAMREVQRLGQEIEQDEIIEMARQIGFSETEGLFKTLYISSPSDIKAFAKLVAEKEREACAAMSDWILKDGGGTWGDAIRAREQA